MSEQENISYFIGSKGAKLMEDFNQGLKEIEERYSGVLEDIPLSDYYTMVTTPHGTNINFREDKPLDEEVKSDILQLFENTFSN